VHLAPALFSVFWVSVLAWCLLVAGLERRLAVRHPLVHAALGRSDQGLPLGREMAVLRFLCTGRDRWLQDPELGRRCGLLRVLLAGYMAFFFATSALLAS
jgi:hypothetical protein